MDKPHPWNTVCKQWEICLWLRRLKPRPSPASGQLQVNNGHFLHQQPKSRTSYQEHRRKSTPDEIRDTCIKTTPLLADERWRADYTV